MWKLFNNNPLGLNVGDCTVRAISAVTGWDWYTAHKATYLKSREMADVQDADRVWWAVLRDLGFHHKRMIDLCPDCYTVADFALDHPQGVFVLGPKEHAVAVISGRYWDSYDSGGMVPTYYFWR